MPNNELCDKINKAVDSHWYRWTIPALPSDDKQADFIKKVPPEKYIKLSRPILIQGKTPNSVQTTV